MEYSKGGCDSGGIAARKSTDYNKAAVYLKQIIHSIECAGGCKSTMCKQTTSILLHCNSCRDEFCMVSGCTTTKKLLIHTKTCFIFHSLLRNRLSKSNPLACSHVSSSVSNDCSCCVLCSLVDKKMRTMQEINSNVVSPEHNTPRDNKRSRCNTISEAELLGSKSAPFSSLAKSSDYQEFAASLLYNYKPFVYHEKRQRLESV